jgi:lycopene beta-cyclase
MDATVPQEGGYRFIYVLPFGPDVVLVEDTVYENQPAHDETRSRRAIERYVAGRGWTVASELRQERGALPIPLAGRLDDVRAHHVAGLPTIGVRAGLMHPTTGYSLPYAVRTAELIATAPTLTSAALLGPVAELARTTFERQRFLRLLNRLMFRAAEPLERYRVLQKFYRLPEPTIARFYADRLTMLDKARLLTGRPPVSVGRALGCLAERIDR